jgi:NAD(P)-dependent dehydrogenase (short-subunit alcohol dehydrogenase family)
MKMSQPKQLLKGKRTIITGGSTGVGRATAQLLAANGCRVFICGRNEEHLEDALREVRASGGDINGVNCDLATPDGIDRLFSEADQWLGGLDFAILNAGLGAHGALTMMSHHECREVVAVNLTSYISCSLEAIKRMGKNGGHVVMTGSMSAHVFDGNAAVYVATKSGVRGFAYSLRKDANPLGIKVSLIEPGAIGTDMVDESTEEQQRMNRENLMLKAEDVAECIFFMLTRPKWCDVIHLQVRPHLQLI